MRILLLASALAASGCADLSPPETVFNMTLDRAHAVECDIKSLERTEHRTRIECFDSDRFDPARSQRRGLYGRDSL